MQMITLLGAKTIQKAEPTTVACSVVNSGGSWRLRVAINKGDFAKLAPTKIVGPKAQIVGSVVSGLCLTISPSTGVAVHDASKNVVATAISGRSVEATENKVHTAPTPAVLVTYSDGSSCLLIAPLPLAFISTKMREAFNSRGWPQIPAPFQEAFQKARYEQHLAPRVVKTEPSPAKTAPESAPVVKPKPVEEVAPVQTHRPTSTDELKELLTLVNVAVSELSDAGAMVKLRIEDGLLKGTIVREEEL